MADTVQIQLEVLAKSALKSVEDFTKKSQSQLETIGLGTAVAGIAGGVAIASKAFEVFGGIARASVGAAIEAEDSTAKLANSMRLVGDFSESATKGMISYADALAKTTLASDDQIISAVALAKSFQLTNKEAKDVVSAATELSAITGDSLNSSVEKLAKTYNGFLSKELKQLAPETRNLTRAQLENGAAVEAIANKFGGSAQAATQTFGGSLKQLSKAFGELAEEMGKTVTENQAVIEETKKTTDTVNGLRSALFGGKLAFKDFVSAFFNAETSGDKSFFNLLAKSAKEAEDGSKNLLTALEKVKLSANESTKEKVISDKVVAERKFQAFREKAEEDFLKIKDELQRAGLSESQKVVFDSEKKIKEVKDAALAGNVIAVKNQEKFIAAIRVDEAKKLQENLFKIRSEGEAAEAKLAQEQRDAIEKSAKEPIRRLVVLAFGGGLDTKAAIGVGAGLVNNILKGAQGAQSVVSSAISGIADTLLPGIGGTVSEILGVLSGGPEKVRETVRAFVSAIPQIITSIVDAVPVLIEELVKAIPVLVQKLTEAIPAIIDALIKAIPGLVDALVAALPQLVAALAKEMPKIGVALATAMPRVALAFGIELIKNIPSIVKGFGEELLKLPGQLIDAIISGLKDAIGSVGGLIGGGGGGGRGGGGGVGGIISGVVDFFDSLNPFAEGGRVPNVPKFEGDKFPAKLNAGEQVLGKDLSEKLDSFLSGQQNKPMQITLNVGQSELARVILDLNRNGFRTA